MKRPVVPPYLRSNKGFLAVQTSYPLEVCKLNSIWGHLENDGPRTAKTKESRDIKLSVGKSISGRGCLGVLSLASTKSIIVGPSWRTYRASLEDICEKLSGPHIFTRHQRIPINLAAFAPRTLEHGVNLTVKFSGGPFFHKEHIPASVSGAVKPNYLKLARPELLAKCLHENTENHN